jgi:rRNA maturation protein Nop10
MKLKFCKSCKKYTLKEDCDKCKEKSKPAHYKFLNLKDAPNTFKPKPQHRSS